METVLENFVLIDKYPIFKLFLQGEIVIVCHTEQEARNCIDWLAEHDITYVNYSHFLAKVELESSSSVD